MLSVGVEDFAILFVRAYPPFGINLLVFDCVTLFALIVSFVVLFFLILAVVNARWQVGLESKVVYNLLKSLFEVQWWSVEVPLLCIAKEVLDSYIYNVQKSCGKQLVLALEITVCCLVLFDV